MRNRLLFVLLASLGAACHHKSSPPDQDGDGVPDSKDDCPAVFESRQADADEDGIGDVCDAEVVDIPGDRLIIPPSVTYEMTGSGCYLDVRIDGTLTVTPSDGSSGGTVELIAQSLEIGASGVIQGTAAGLPGGTLATQENVGGHAGSGAGAGCGGGPGSSVGQGGSGAGHGGVGGTVASTNPHGIACSGCDVPTEAHCHGAAGAAYDVADDSGALPGSGGGAAGNSASCLDGAEGGAGGAAVVLRASTLVIAGTIAVDGESPAPIASPGCGYRPGGGGGAGGAIVLASSDLTIATGAVLSAQGGKGGDSLGAVDLSESEISTWAWAGGGGGGGRIKLFAPARAVAGTVNVAGGAGGTVPLADDGDSFPGMQGSDGTSFEGDTIPVDLATFTCP